LNVLISYVLNGLVN